MIELAILGFLKEQPLHGYELRTRLNELLGSANGLSFGALYPALARLERAGLLHSDDEPRGHVAHMIPSSASLTGELAAFRTRTPRGTTSRRGRKAYRITTRGDTRLRELLNGTARHDQTFRLQLAFCRHLNSRQRMELLTRRHADLAQRRDKLAELGPTRDTISDRYRRALREHDIASLTNDLAWLEQLMAAEPAEALPMEETTR